MTRSFYEKDWDTPSISNPEVGGTSALTTVYIGELEIRLTTKEPRADTGRETSEIGGRGRRSVVSRLRETVHVTYDPLRSFHPIRVPSWSTNV